MWDRADEEAYREEYYNYYGEYPEEEQSDGGFFHAANEGRKEEAYRRAQKKAIRRNRQKHRQAEWEADEESNRIKTAEIRARREKAKAQGKRIQEDAENAIVRKAWLLAVVNVFLLYRFAVRGRLFGEDVIVRAVLVSMALALPMFLLSSLGLELYGNKTLFGLEFPGSAFLRTYLGTLGPSLIAMYVVCYLLAIFAHLTFSARTILILTGIYLLTGLAGWFLNHFALPYIWKNGYFKYYFK